MDINQKHSEIYTGLTQDEKDKVDAVLSFLEGENIARIKILLAAANRELDFRSSLNHQ